MGTSWESSAYNHTVKILSGLGMGFALAKQAGTHEGQPAALTQGLSATPPLNLLTFLLSLFLSWLTWRNV